MPRLRAFHDRLARFARLIVFDRRGTGLSDRLREPATLEARMDDLRAVLDAVNSVRAVLLGTFEAASMCLLFAATYPERTLGLALYNPVARGEQLADWLAGFEVTLVGMEATGVYWRPVFWVLERRFECRLVNAQHLHNVPGGRAT
jgi:pimeloyl-ACP methyl ester carboxylesterase